MTSTNIKTYKVPQDVISDILRILFKNGIKHKIKSVQPDDNIITVEVDYYGIRSNDPRKNIETILDDYREFMKDIIGEAILNMVGESNEEEED